MMFGAFQGAFSPMQRNRIAVPTQMSQPSPNFNPMAMNAWGQAQSRGLQNPLLDQRMSRIAVPIQNHLQPQHQNPLLMQRQNMLAGGGFQGMHPFFRRGMFW